MRAKTIFVSGKCSDLCYMTIYDADGKVLHEHDGYVPSFFPSGGGDAIDLEIDLATGTILNWVPPTTDAALVEKDWEDEDDGVAEEDRERGKK